MSRTRSRRQPDQETSLFGGDLGVGVGVGVGSAGATALLDPPRARDSQSAADASGTADPSAAELTAGDAEALASWSRVFAAKSTEQLIQRLSFAPAQTVYGRALRATLNQRLAQPTNE